MNALTPPKPQFLGSGGISCAFLNIIHPTGVPPTFRLAELGVWHGDTSLAFAQFMNHRGTLDLFDYAQFALAAQIRLNQAGFANVNAYPNSDRSLDSYNWSLMKLLRDNTTPIYDYVYLDGSHSWAIDGFAFCLIDRLLKPGGFIDFDDYDWSYASSPGANPITRPATAQMFTQEQIDATQVQLIVDLLVRRSGRYVEVVDNKIFLKTE